MLAILLLAAAALVLVPAENRALLQGLWTNPPVLEAGPAPANPDEAVRQLFGTPPPAPAEGGSPAGTSEADPLIDQGDIRLAVELMDFIRPHGSGTDGVEEKPKP